MTTRLYTHDLSVEHITPPGHPERPDRIRALDKALSAPKFDTLERIDAPRGNVDYFSLAHPEAFIERLIEAIPEEGIVKVDADTCASPKSWEAVLHVNGATMDAVDAIIKGEANNAFVAMRPPGHHAEKQTAMGFCLVNNVAIAARYAQQEHGLERIAIVDWDVHHGNGTQDIFYEDETVLFASTHQMPLYPGSGAVSETGVGNIVNAPLRAEDGGQHFREAFRERILPEIDAFAPDMIFISAGFDAHHLDPLANINLVEDDFDWATGKIMDLSEKHCDSRILSLLEGGYDLQGLAQSGATHVNRLMNG